MARRMGDNHKPPLVLDHGFTGISGANCWPAPYAPYDASAAYMIWGCWSDKAHSGKSKPVIRTVIAPSPTLRDEQEPGRTVFTPSLSAPQQALIIDGYRSAK